MLEKTIQSDLFVELSAESQELLSGGQTLPVPAITVRGILTSGDQSFPVLILGFATEPTTSRPGGAFGRPGGAFGGF
ncbi:MAG: hypothetical protein EA343_19355 [Nodularia sp. (in: Bacteria)]|nr:MAG: hypothetical protein EA343_19355 [Nodularia sp. (in: cyanobacteria)]